MANACPTPKWTNHHIDQLSMCMNVSCVAMWMCQGELAFHALLRHLKGAWCVHGHIRRLPHKHHAALRPSPA